MILCWPHLPDKVIKNAIDTCSLYTLRVNNLSSILEKKYIYISNYVIIFVTIKKLVKI